jgi:hypothetical protein
MIAKLIGLITILTRVRSITSSHRIVPVTLLTFHNQFQSCLGINGQTISIGEYHYWGCVSRRAVDIRLNEPVARNREAFIDRGDFGVKSCFVLCRVLGLPVALHSSSVVSVCQCHAEATFYPQDISNSCQSSSSCPDGTYEAFAVYCANDACDNIYANFTVDPTWDVYFGRNGALWEWHMG